MIDKNFFHLHRKAGHRILLLLGTVAFVLFVLAVMAIHGAAHLFNKAMEEQTLLRGTIEVETISADIMGNVHFTALQWHDPEGNLILYVPDGSLTVRPWDILRRSFRSTTISDITLNDATIAAYLHKDKHWDIIEPQKGEQKKPQKQPRSYGERIRNINWNGQKIDATIHLNNCRLEAYYSGRAYAMEAVHAAISARTGKKSTIHVTTGRFNGDAIGDGIAITGALNLQHEVPTTDLHVSFVNVDPSSLGFGNAIHDKMTLKLHITGPLDNPTGKGSITMDQLELPALQFTDIHGDVSYAKDTLTFSDVHAKVYGGTLDAYGTYTIPTRAYTIHGEGHDLSSSTALRDFKFRTKVSIPLRYPVTETLRISLPMERFNREKGCISPSISIQFPVASIINETPSIFMMSSFLRLSVRLPQMPSISTMIRLSYRLSTSKTLAALLYLCTSQMNIRISSRSTNKSKIIYRA